MPVLLSNLIEHDGEEIQCILYAMDMVPILIIWKEMFFGSSDLQSRSPMSMNSVDSMPLGTFFYPTILSFSVCKCSLVSALCT